MIKAIVDTNVLISGIISTKSSPAKIIDLWHERKFILVTSKKILQEVERVLNYPKITKKYHLNKEKITDFLKGLSTFSEVCSPRKKILIIKKILKIINLSKQRLLLELILSLVAIVIYLN